MPTSQLLAPVFGLLSNLYLCKPTADAIASWRAVLAHQTIPDLDELKAALHGIDLSSGQECEELLWEYTRLFVGPYRLPCPPWESLYTSSKRLLMQEAHDTVKAVYAEAGVELGDPNILADHVGAELNFLAILLERTDRGAAGEHASQQRAEKFLDEHLRNWIPRFTADLEDAAGSALYRALARTTRRLVLDFGREQEETPASA
jgi:TorA maturation chaperone TorD